LIARGENGLFQVEGIEQNWVAAFSARTEGAKLRVRLHPNERAAKKAQEHDLLQMRSPQTSFVADALWEQWLTHKARHGVDVSGVERLAHEARAWGGLWRSRERRRPDVRPVVDGNSGRRGRGDNRVPFRDAGARPVSRHRRTLGDEARSGRPELARAQGRDRQVRRPRRARTNTIVWVRAVDEPGGRRLRKVDRRIDVATGRKTVDGHQRRTFPTVRLDKDE